MPFRLFLKYIDDSFASLIDDHRWPLYVLHILFFLEEVNLVYFMTLIATQCNLQSSRFLHS